jgi:hypothetical protein
MRSRRHKAKIRSGRNEIPSEYEKTPPSDSRETAGSKLSYGSSKGTVVSPCLFLFFICSYPHLPLTLTHTSTPPPSPSPSPSPSPTLLLFPSNSFEMIMVQKPVHLLSSPSGHRRHPSAPPTVLVQPTRIPGLLSLSQPAPVTPPRSQQQHHHNHHNRQTRSTYNKTKPASTARQSPQLPAVTAQPQPSDDLNKVSPSIRPSAKSNIIPTTISPTPAKPPRGRQNSKQSKDKSQPR